MSTEETNESSTLYKNLSSVKDIFSTTVDLKRLGPNDDETTGGGSDIQIDIRGTLTAVGGSTRDPQDTNKSYDVFLLCRYREMGLDLSSHLGCGMATHCEPAYNLGFTPPAGQEISMYSIMLRALQDENTASTDFETVSNALPNGWDGNDDFTGNRFAWGDPATSQDSTWLSTQPNNVDNTSSYSTSTSYSFGANAGFFGNVPTAGKGSHTYE